jgi:hypothetical protein
MEQLIKYIVQKAFTLKDRYTDQKNIPVYYACIFCQTSDEYNLFIEEANKLGRKVEERSNSLLFRISPIDTVAGKLELLRVRQPDATRPERGDADFIVPDYPSFKSKYLNEPGFKLIPRNGSEMIELHKERDAVRVYFSAPELIKSLLIL